MSRILYLSNAIHLTAVAALVPFWVSEARAAGFALREYGFEAASTSFAGASAQTGSAAFLAYNPASSSGVDAWDAQFTLNAIYPTSDAVFSLATTTAHTNTGGSSTPGDFIKDAYEPGLAIRLRLDDDWTAGISVSAPWGLGTRYNKEWAGRYYAVESRLITVNIAPSLAYRVNSELVLSAGAQVQYAKGTLSNAIDFGTIGLAFGGQPGLQDGFVEFDADDWAFGYVLGALWQPSAEVSLGASYRSRLEHNLQGKVDFSLGASGMGAALSGISGAFVDTSGRTDLTMPAIASIGGALELSPQVTLLAEVGYTQWSELRELRVKFANPLQPDNVQLYNWKDTWLGAIGLRYQPTPDWTFRTGIALDESPATDATRDPRIPDANRTWLAFGIEHKLTERTSLQVGYARLIFPPEPIDLRATTPGNEVRGNLVGRTDADADMISFQLTFR
ncbi:MAG: outer membrane protein transport protein [Alphaproteobacteria bacterium]|nr:outer membrane protein transport protein [Alphaproteobacteria bacterium]